MSIFKRLTNLWELSKFEITDSDNKLVITKKDTRLVIDVPEKPKMAQIIKRENLLKKVIQEE